MVLSIVAKSAVYISKINLTGLSLSLSLSLCLSVSLWMIKRVNYDGHLHKLIVSMLQIYIKTF